MTGRYKDIYRLCWRQLRRHPWFVAGATLSLALGMALATAVFSVMEAVRHDAFPWDTEGRVVRITETHWGNDAGRVSPAFLQLLAGGVTTLSDVAAHRSGPTIVGRTGEARRVHAARVTRRFFEVLGVRPIIGASFDDPRASENDILISHPLWKARFGGRIDVVGARLTIGTEVFTVIGVAPPNFDYPDRTAVWLRLPDEELVVRASAGTPSRGAPMRGVGRLREGVVLSQADAEMATLIQRARGNDQPRMLSARVTLLRDYIARSMRSRLTLWTAAAIVILILCAVNFAALCLARGMRRRIELALRASLGASRDRMSLMLLAEATTVAAVAAALTVLFASWLIRFADLWLHASVTVQPHMGVPTILFGVLGTVLVGFLFAVAPALQLASVDLRSVLHGGDGATPQTGEMRGRRGIVALQLALALAAVATVASLMKADRQQHATSVGFDHSGLIVGVVTLADPAADILPSRPLLQYLLAQPGVSGAATLSGCSDGSVVTDEGFEVSEDLISCRTSGDFFRSIGMPLLAGQLPSETEIATRQQGVVLSRSAAVRAFGAVTDAIGRTIVVRRLGWSGASNRVLGVVADGGSALYGFAPSVYRLGQPHGLQTAVMLVRVGGEPQARVRELERTLGAFDSRLTVSDLNTATAIVDQALRANRGRNLFLAAVASLALLLAGIGVFSLTSYTTELRARDFGIRIALGASPFGIVRIVLTDLAWVTIIGILAGLATSWYIVAMLDTALRSPWMKESLVSLAAIPTVSCIAALVFTLAIGTVMPLRRILRMDVVKTIQRST